MGEQKARAEQWWVSNSGKGAAIYRGTLYVAWALFVTVFMSAMMLSIAAHGFSWNPLTTWDNITPYLAPVSPWVLTAGALVQAALASRRQAQAEGSEEAQSHVFTNDASTPLISWAGLS
ncbi:hypothetical protein [Arthrobacter sp. HMWF013]|uniref:hypothetical protein n=1 Tax=Arthrobacter sp. HMWF013 TaxID=2056849 RepID=UPI000D35B831|nr:hypothetical protein [Arthrobacter sp. HMWF013]PTT65192.1 hypothetical protein DBR22_12950 [Arthrobacter sp. HMWF013]